MIKSILLVAFGAIFFLGSLVSIIDGPRSLDNIQVVQGEIITVQGAEDKELGVKTEAPVLFRHVEMLQNLTETTKGYADYPVTAKVLIKGKADSTSNKDSDNPNSEINIRARERFSNPEFPKWGGKTFIFGTATVGKNGPKLSQDLLQKLAYDGKYPGFTKGPYRKQLMNLPDPLNLYLVNKGSFYATNDDENKVGHTRVTYYIGQGQGVYTVAGEVKDGVIGLGTKPAYIFDGPRTKKEIVASFDKEEEATGMVDYGLVVVGAAMLYFGVRGFLRRRSGKE